MAAASSARRLRRHPASTTVLAVGLRGRLRDGQAAATEAVLARRGAPPPPCRGRGSAASSLRSAEAPPRPPSGSRPAVVLGDEGTNGTKRNTPRRAILLRPPRPHDHALAPRRRHPRPPLPGVHGRGGSPPDSRNAARHGPAPPPAAPGSRPPRRPPSPPAPRALLRPRERPVRRHGAPPVAVPRVAGRAPAAGARRCSRRDGAVPSRDGRDGGTDLALATGYGAWLIKNDAFDFSAK